MTVFCTAPFVGIVVDPIMNIQMCCSDGSKHFKTNLRNISSLRDFFYNSAQYQKLRQDVSKYSLSEYRPCFKCKVAEKGFAAELNNYNEHFPVIDPIKLRYLEVTTSNVCTQTCVMCTPYFSSSLVKLHGVGHVSSMTDGDLKKVFEVLPEIEMLNIKGGEPFADQKNLKILEELYRVNPNVNNITIISNGAHIPTTFQDILVKFKSVTLSISIDGIDEVYEWHRGSPYYKTVNSLNSFFSNTGIQYNIQSAITVYNLPSVMKSTVRYFEDFEGLRYVSNSNIVTDPMYVSPRLYDDGVLFMLTELNAPTELQYFISNHGIDKIISYPTEEFQKHHCNFKKHTDFYNKHRGFNILDYVPEAKELYNLDVG